MIVADRGILRGDRALPYCRYFIVITGFSGASVRFHDPTLGPDRELPLARVFAAFALAPAGRSALLIR